jgi:Tol biopolymer transport system component
MADSTAEGKPAWSPDGVTLAVTTRPQWGGDGRISLVSLDGRGRRDLGVGDAPSWSPDGRWIAFLRRWAAPGPDDAIFVVHPDGSGLTRVFLSGRRTPADAGAGRAAGGVPLFRMAWSPDSRWIAFARGSGGGSSVWKLDLRTGDLRQVTSPGT